MYLIKLGVLDMAYETRMFRHLTIETYIILFVDLGDPAIINVSARCRGPGFDFR